MTSEGATGGSPAQGAVRYAKLSFDKTPPESWATVGGPVFKKNAGLVSVLAIRGNLVETPEVPALWGEQVEAEERLARLGTTSSDEGEGGGRITVGRVIDLAMRLSMQDREVLAASLGFLPARWHTQPTYASAASQGNPGTSRVVVPKEPSASNMGFYSSGPLKGAPRWILNQTDLNRALRKKWTGGISSLEWDRSMWNWNPQTGYVTRRLRPKEKPQALTEAEAAVATAVANLRRFATVHKLGPYESPEEDTPVHDEYRVLARALADAKAAKTAVKDSLGGTPTSGTPSSASNTA
jgi:hypothetical protein